MTTRKGWNEEKFKKKWLNTLLEDLPGGKRNKKRVKLAKKPTGGLLKGGKKKIIGEKGQNKYDVCEERCFVVATSFLGAIHKLGSKKYRN